MRKERVEWNYFDRFENVTKKYLPKEGEGDNMAMQIVTATCKLVYRWYNDGDIYDNTYILNGWGDVSSYANWLSKYADAEPILEKIAGCWDEADYEEILANLATKLLNEEYLSKMATEPKKGTIYECEGQFIFEDYREEDAEE